jgi:hypothetical protein
MPLQNSGEYRSARLRPHEADYLLSKHKLFKIIIACPNLERHWIVISFANLDPNLVVWPAL